MEDGVIDITITDTVNVEGRGVIFVVEDKGSPVPLRKLGRAKIRVDGKIYDVVGFECWAIEDYSELRVAGLLVRPQAA